MATMTINVKLTDLGVDPDGFTVLENYPNADFTNTPLASSLMRATSDIVQPVGLTITGVNELSTIIRVTSTLNGCTNSIDMSIGSSGKFLTAAAGVSKLRVSNNYGVDWVLPTFPSGLQIVSCDINSSGAIQVAGASTGVFKSTDYGVSWALLNGSPTIMNEIAISADGSIIAAGPQSAGLFWISSDSGVNWTSYSSPLITQNIKMTPDGGTIITNRGSKLYKTTTSGGTITEIQNSSTISAISSDGLIIYSKTETLPTNPLFKSIDGGATFSEVVNTQNYKSSAYNGMACSSSGLVIAIAHQSSVYISEDGGTSWVTKTPTSGTSNYHYLSMSSDGLVMSVVNVHSGYTFVSVDGGDSWSQRDIATTKIQIATNRL